MGPELQHLLPAQHRGGRRFGAFMPCLLAISPVHALSPKSAPAARASAQLQPMSPVGGGAELGEGEEVPVLLFVPCRTATRGQFPLNGTYFQTNEVFLDHSSVAAPIMVSGVGPIPCPHSDRPLGLCPRL